MILPIVIFAKTIVTPNSKTHQADHLDGEDRERARRPEQPRKPSHYPREAVVRRSSTRLKECFQIPDYRTRPAHEWYSLD